MTKPLIACILALMVLSFGLGAVLAGRPQSALAEDKPANGAPAATESGKPAEGPPAGPRRDGRDGAGRSTAGLSSPAGLLLSGSRG